MTAKPWQIALIAVGLVVGIASVVYNAVASGGPNLRHQYFLIDVQSGQVYEVDARRTRLILPATNPETGKISLVGIEKDEKGQWIVNPKDRAALAQLDQGVVNSVVDAETGTLKSPAKAPITYVEK